MPIENQLLQTAEIWFQRTCRLRAIWQDNNKPKHVKQKAFRLWGIMYQRMLSATRHEKQATDIK
jgi:hypothetical protein